MEWSRGTGWPFTTLKVLGTAGEAIAQRRTDVSWPLPDGDRPGDWTPWEPDPQPCQQGWHLNRNVMDLVHQPLGPTIWLAEVHPQAIVRETDRYIVTSSARLVTRLEWAEEQAWRVALGAAARVLPFFEEAQPWDDRPRAALSAAERYARGEAGFEEWRAALQACEGAVLGLSGGTTAAFYAADAISHAVSSHPEWWFAARDAGFAARNAAVLAGGYALGLAEWRMEAATLVSLLGTDGGAPASLEDVSPEPSIRSG